MLLLLLLLLLLLNQKKKQNKITDCLLNAFVYNQNYIKFFSLFLFIYFYLDIYLLFLVYLIIPLSDSINRVSTDLSIESPYFKSLINVLFYFSSFRSSVSLLFFSLIKTHRSYFF